MNPFPYFKDPTHPLSSWRGESTICDFCGTQGPGFEGPFYGLRDDVERICETCLRGGKLADLDLSTCEGDAAALIKQLSEANANLSEAQLDERVTELTLALEQRTPGLTTWQYFMWPAHCGDYCQFTEELGRPEIVELAGSVDPQTWFVGNVPHATPDLWHSVRRNSARENPTESYDLTVYAFSCRNCRAAVLHWDAS